MKYIKTFESVHLKRFESIFKREKEPQFEFKVGDYVRVKGKDDILRIAAIEPEFKGCPYSCRDIKTHKFMTPFKKRLELVPDYEIRAIKYNI